MPERNCQGCGCYTEHIISKTTSTCEVCGLEKTTQEGEAVKSFVTDAKDVEKSSIEAWLDSIVDAEIQVKDYSTSEGVRFFDVYVSVPGQRVKLLVSYNIETFEQNFIFENHWATLTPENLFKHLWKEAVKLLPKEGK